MTQDLPDYYAVLGVASTASPAQIAHAYRSRIRSQHPDVHPDTGSDELSTVVAAYAVLRDPARRADYDQQRQSSTSQPTTSRSTASQSAASRSPTNSPSPPAFPSSAPFVQPSRPQPLLRVGPVRYHGPPHRGHQ